MIFFYIFLSLVFIFLVITFLLSLRGIPRSLNSVKRALQDLLNRGYKNGFLVIKIRRSSKKFVQFYKYINKGKEYGIVLSFPIVDWSIVYEKEFRKLCLAHHLNIDESKKTLKFLDVDFGKDINLAHSFLEQLIMNIFGENEHIKVYVTLENASKDFDTVITSS